MKYKNKIKISDNEEETRDTAYLKTEFVREIVCISEKGWLSVEKINCCLVSYNNIFKSIFLLALFWLLFHGTHVNSQF